MTPARRQALLELGVLAAILVLAAVVRLPGIDVRGQWDSDQGKDMTVLAAFVQHGQWPLLGPMTSVGTFHHGALYYYLLAPAAFLSGADPVAVTIEFALLGIAAVAATWWLARLVGGPMAAAVAALLLAVSPAGISESTFIWNPNPIPLFAALAAGGVIAARRSGRLRWWVIAAVGTMATMQLHWLGGTMAAPVALAWALELRRARREGRDTAVLRRAGIIGVAVLVAGYLPLAIHEVTHDASELRAIAAYALGGGDSAQTGILGRLLMVGVRALTWPVAGLLTDRVSASLAALAIVVTAGAVGVTLAGRRSTTAEARADARPGKPEAGAGAEADERWAARWLVGAIGLSVVALAFLAPSLAVIVPGLPNDHYHAFLDPIVVTLVGLGVAVLVRAGRTASRTALLAPAMGAALAAALAGIAVTAWPPAISPDGGWRLVDLAAGHIVVGVHGNYPTEPRILASLPDFKPDDALRFPLDRRGFGLEPKGAAEAGTTGVLTIVCDPLFDESKGFPCGGPAEDKFLAATYPPGTLQLAERFRAGARRIISIYAPSRLASH
ncbi:MAG: glycosyltransferase family 39 protein [Chloroflexota bacterium]